MPVPGFYKRQKKIGGLFKKWKDFVSPIIPNIVKEIKERLPGVVDTMRKNIKRLGLSVDGAVHFINNNVIKKEDSKIMMFIDTLVPGGPLKDEIVDLVSKWIDSDNYQNITALLTDVVVGGDPYRAVETGKMLKNKTPSVKFITKKRRNVREDTDDEDEDSDDDDDSDDEPRPIRGTIRKNMSNPRGFTGFGNPIN